MGTLYDLTGEYLELFNMMAELDSMEEDGAPAEVIDEQRQLITDSLEAVKGELEVKANGYVAVLKELGSREEVARSEAAEWTRKADALKRHKERLKAALMDAMIQTGHDGKDGLDTGIYKLKVVGNGGNPPIEVDDDIDCIPDEYIRIKKEPDKKAILEYLKSLPEDITVPWARLLPRGKHLTIK